MVFNGLPSLAFMDDLERISVRVEYISGIVSRTVFQSCAARVRFENARESRSALVGGDGEKPPKKAPKEILIVSGAKA